MEKTASVNAKLDSSLDDKTLYKTVKIKGVAYGEDFQEYILECGRGLYPDDNDWIQIKTSSKPIYVESALAHWDTTNVDDGFYTLRLRINAGDYTYEDQTLIVIHNEINTFYVDDDNIVGPWEGSQDYPFKKIQDAIDGCGNGDTVFVYSGIYYENLWIDRKSINMIGQDKETTIIENNYDNINNWIISYPTVEINAAKGVKISGFTMRSDLDSGPDPLMAHDNIKLFFSSDCTISDNNLYSTILSRGGGIDLYDSSNNKITENNLTDTNSISIRGRLSFNNIISDNILENFYVGIILAGCIYNKIYNNTISKNPADPFETNYGIKICDHSYCNEIYSNKITNNSYGIYVDEYSLNNHLYYNNFIDNIQNAHDEENNLWYLIIEKEGNYWDDYTGVDADGDGIGDIPYYIPGGDNKDKYPLMNPCEESSQYSEQSSPQQSPQEQSLPSGSPTNS